MENISEKFFIENFDDEMLFQFEENKGYRMIDLENLFMVVLSIFKVDI